jgi:hypothetical protein
MGVGVRAKKKTFAPVRCKSLAKPYWAGKARPLGQDVDFTLGSYSPLLELYYINMMPTASIFSLMADRADGNLRKELPMHICYLSIISIKYITIQYFNDSCLCGEVGRAKDPPSPK